MNSFFYFLFIYFNFCNVMLISAAEECKLYVIICTSTPSLASLPSPSLQVSTEHQTGLPSSLLPFSLALHLTPQSVHMLMLLLFISIRKWFISSLCIPQLAFSFYCFFCYVETFQFDVIPLINFCFCYFCNNNKKSFLCHIQKTMAKSNVKAFLQRFLLVVLSL